MRIYVRIVRSFGKSPMVLIFGPAKVSKYFHFWFCGPFLAFLTRFDTLTQLWPSWETPEVPTRLMELAPHELNCCLAGVVSLGCSDHKFFVSVGKSAQARHSFRNSNRIKPMKKHKPEILYNLGKTSKVFWQNSGRFGVKSRFIDDLWKRSPVSSTRGPEQTLSQCVGIPGRQGIRPSLRKSWDLFWRFCPKCAWYTLTFSPRQLKLSHLEFVSSAQQRSCDVLEHCHVVEWRMKPFVKPLVMTSWADGQRANQQAIQDSVAKTLSKHAGALQCWSSTTMICCSSCFRWSENPRRSLQMPSASFMSCIYLWSQCLSRRFSMFLCSLNSRKRYKYRGLYIMDYI